MDYNYFEAVCDDVREVIAESWARTWAKRLKRARKMPMC